MARPFGRLAPLFLLAAVANPAAAAPKAPPSAAELRDAALKDDLAWDLTEGLTTEIGQRQAGTEAEARARDWAVVRLKALGFANVHIETFSLPVWMRGEERAEIVSPFPQKLVLTALGNSGATPAEGLTAEIAAFASMDALIAADPRQVRGKIVFLSHRMGVTQDGSSYGAFGTVRRMGPSEAARKGAAAIVIRSIGTDRQRSPHTGGQSWAAGVTPIPAAALSVPDAEQLERILKRGKPVTMRLVLTPRNIGLQPSGNVIADVPGRDPKAGIVLVGGHLDSWDLGTGAIDDAAGVAITTAAAKRIMDAGRPLRTIRVVWFGSEEVGGAPGGSAYRDRHRTEKHVLVAESDSGSDRVWRFDSNFADPNSPVAKAIAAALQPLGIARGGNDAGGGSDIRPMVDTGVPVLDLQQDASRYFDYHHTPGDTLDRVDPEQLRQNVAAWTAMLAVVANSRDEFGPMKPKPR